uniref:TlpA family protein disulfide reductase n=1 Tax=Flavobacterium sp. TaxID=239 RepID=UPI00404B886A
MLFLFIVFGCKNEKVSRVEKVINTKNQDSLEIHVKLLPRVAILLNYVNDFYETESPMFENSTDSAKTVIKKIKLTKPTLFTYLGLAYDEGKLTSFEHNFLVNQNTKILYIDYQKNADIKVTNDKKDIMLFDEIVKDYKDFTFSNQIKENNLNGINNLYEKWNSNFKKEKEYDVLTEINKFEYLKAISLLNISRDSSLFKKVDFTVNLNLHQARSFYLDYIKASNNNYDSKFKDNQLYNKIIYNYLKENRYDKNIILKKGLLNSDFYKQNKSKIDSTLEISSDISSKILELEILTTESKTILLKDFFKQNNKEYYLLEFWATWCAPCLEEIKILKRKKIQIENLDIINLSLDKTKSFSKWIEKSNQFSLKNSFLITESQQNFELLKELEVNVIPRFILIKKTGEILQINFKKPSENDFDKTLLNLADSE